MHTIGVVIGIVLVLIFLGVLFWAGKQIFALIAPYVGEPFMTIIRIVCVILLTVVCLWIIVQLLALGGIVVPFFR